MEVCLQKRARPGCQPHGTRRHCTGNAHHMQKPSMLNTELSTDIKCTPTELHFSLASRPEKVLLDVLDMWRAQLRQQRQSWQDVRRVSQQNLLASRNDGAVCDGKSDGWPPRSNDMFEYPAAETVPRGHGCAEKSSRRRPCAFCQRCIYAASNNFLRETEQGCCSHQVVAGTGRPEVTAQIWPRSEALLFERHRKQLV